MEQAPTQSFASSPYTYVPEYAKAAYVLQGSPHNSYIPSAPVDALDHWVLEGHSDGSPLSTASSVGHYECEATAQYSGAAVYDPVEPQLGDMIALSDNSTAWKREPEQLWQLSYAESYAWRSQSDTLQCHASLNHDQLPLQPMHDYMPLSYTLTYGSYMTQSGEYMSPYPPVTPEYTDSAVSIKAEDSRSNQECDSVSNAPSTPTLHYDDSSCSQKHSSLPTKHRHATHTGKSRRKWSPAYNILRRYECLLQAKTHTHHDSTWAVPCKRRFARFEHLRRHARTVHAKERLYKCKVDKCERSFTRADNAREHYWSHLERGGNSGRNIKMGFTELKAILGPQERKLLGRLKQKLVREMESKGRSTVRGMRVCDG